MRVRRLLGGSCTPSKALGAELGVSGALRLVPNSALRLVPPRPRCCAPASPASSSAAASPSAKEACRTGRKATLVAFDSALKSALSPPRKEARAVSNEEGVCVRSSSEESTAASVCASVAVRERHVASCDAGNSWGIEAAPTAGGGRDKRLSRRCARHGGGKREAARTAKLLSRGAAAAHEAALDAPDAPEAAAPALSVSSAWRARAVRWVAQRACARPKTFAERSARQMSTACGYARAMPAAPMNVQAPTGTGGAPAPPPSPPPPPPPPPAPGARECRSKVRVP